MPVFTHIDFDHHEQVVFGHDQASGLKAIIAVHDTTLGPALGGCRMWNYASDEEALRDSGSYPSGHTAIGWAWGLILAEIDPEHANALIDRGRNYGHSRLVCNVHWYSDVQQGQFMGAAAVARLHGNPEFMADLAKARIELAYARTLGLAPPRDCMAEAKVLATGLSEAR